MTPASPTWGDIEAFLRADGWRQVGAGERGGRRQKHIFFDKLLDDGRLLQTHISHDRAAGPGPTVFGLILAHQLKVGRAEFWEAIRTGRPVSRPVAVEEVAPVELPGWAVEVLVSKLRMGVDELSCLSEDDAVRIVHEYWAQGTQPGSD